MERSSSASAIVKRKTKIFGYNVSLGFLLQYVLIFFPDLLLVFFYSVVDVLLLLLLLCVCFVSCLRRDRPSVSSSSERSKMKAKVKTAKNHEKRGTRRKCFRCRWDTIPLSPTLSSCCPTRRKVRLNLYTPYISNSATTPHPTRRHGQPRPSPHAAQQSTAATAARPPRA